MRTNRDLYKRIAGLLHEVRGPGLPSLEVYLATLLERAEVFASREWLEPEEFFGLLSDSFRPVTPLPLPRQGQGIPAYEAWKTEVSRQIQDLREMAANGQLGNGLRHFGIRAPSGGLWFNFDPCAYLECAAVGSLGGWEEGDETGRMCVEGLVAGADADEKPTAYDPRVLERPATELPQITWAVFRDFVQCGQWYE